MLKGKTIVLGVTGSIAAYKMANVASMLMKLNCDVHVIMTQNATNFINPITFETLTNHKCLVDTFDRDFQYHVAHVSLAQKADAFLIAPATANIIAKMAYGIADDMLSTTILAAKCPKIIAPAMNTNMFENPIVQDNLRKLEQFGIVIIEPETGLLACKDVGKGKMPSEQVLLDFLLKEIAYDKDLLEKKILITAGPTQESIDPVRFITNHSSGKMGYSIAKCAMLRGANVTLVSGPVDLAPPPFVKTIPVTTAKEMYHAVITEAPKQDIIIKAAAVADYCPTHTSDEKVKKIDSNLVLELETTTDILKHLGSIKREHQILCGFSMETQNLIENSKKKLVSKHLDMIVANNLKDLGAGFGTDTNKVTFITSDFVKELELMTKDQVAHQLLSSLLVQLRNGS